MADSRKITRQINMLLKKTSNLEKFFEENAESFVDMRFCDLLYSILEDHHMIAADLVNIISIDRSYIYHIMSGKRLPSRETILEIVFALKLNLNETQMLLHLAGRAQLYARSRHDAIVIYGIQKELSLPEVNRMMQDFGLPLIGNRKDLFQ